MWSFSCQNLFPRKLFEILKKNPSSPIGLMGCRATTELVPLRSISSDKNTLVTEKMIFQPTENGHQKYGNFPGHTPDLLHFFTQVNKN